MGVGLHHGLARRHHAATLPDIRAIKARSYNYSAFGYTTFGGKSASKLFIASNAWFEKGQDLDRFKSELPWFA